MKILIATDAWKPQINGVVTTLENTIRCVRNLGHEVLVISPQDFLCLPNWVYPEISIAVPSPDIIENTIRSFKPNAVHISTEGPIGIATRYLCNKLKCNFTTAYHTKFPEYFKSHLAIPERFTYRFMRWFHDRSQCVMVATDSLHEELSGHGFSKLSMWRRGVDTELFQPASLNSEKFSGEHPILMYVGRVSAEKNIEAFLNCKSAGTKYVVGDGPALAGLKASHPEAVFLGMLRGKELAEAYSHADVMVFPSKSDTFGLVIIESLACGTPVAAYPVTGPIDILSSLSLGACHDDLDVAIKMALSFGNREECRRAAQAYSWDQCALQFLDNLVAA